VATPAQAGGAGWGAFKGKGMLRAQFGQQPSA
jgi:hypothetical protein